MKFYEQESHTLEFKAEVAKQDQIIKTIIGFCNQHGGRLIIGVGDDGTLIGIDENEAIEMMEHIEHSIFQATTPPIMPHVYLQRLMEKVLVVIEVSAGMNKPYYHHSEGIQKGTYIRVGCATVRATEDMIKELQWQARGIVYETLPVYQASLDELDKGLIQKFLKARKQSSYDALTNDVMQSYRLISNEHSRYYPTHAGILLFGMRVQYWLPEAMIICSHFKGISGRDAVASVDCNGTLFSQLEQAMQFIVSRLHHSFKIKVVKRQDKLEIPLIALREIVVNAIVHRNYHHRSPTKIAIYDDRIEVFSPGNFPTPLPNLRLGLTDARNMTICKVFREAGLVEKLGTDFSIVFDSYQQAGLAEPVILDGDGFVKCILPRGIQRVVTLQEGLESKILQVFMGATDVSVSEIMQLLQLHRSTTSRKLKELVLAGRLKTIGIGKATRYTRTE